MPVTWNLTRNSQLYQQQNTAQFNTMPVRMAKQTIKKIQYWSRWKGKYGTIKWQANTGPLLMGIIQEHSPITQQAFTPRNISEDPLKTVVSNYERSNQGRPKRHLFESLIVHFLPSWEDFETKQIAFAQDDINKQIAVAYDNFTRWQVLQQSPAIYVCGASDATGPYRQVVFGEATDTAAPKDTGFFAAMAALVGAAGYLDFKQMCAIRSFARNVIDMPPWEGMKANPGENEIVKGKFILTGESSLYEAMSFDTHVLNTRPLAMDLLNSEFSGYISQNIAFLAERYPLRMLSDGTFPAPEVELQLPALTYGSQFRYETIPNPDNTSAPFGWAFFEGNQGYETIDVGPPPKDFAGKSISLGKFQSLDWNGSVRITDDILINRNGTIDTNKYGEYVQLISDVTLGIMPNTNRYVLPVLYRRNITPSLDPNVV